MQFKTFMVPAGDPGEMEQELNRFLRSHRVIEVAQQLVTDGGGPRWCFCVKYLEGTRSGGAVGARETRVDYKEVLDEKTFAVFAELRAIRKAVSQDEGIPAFAVFTDEQLAAMAKLERLDAETLKTVPGVGAGKVERYAPRFMAALQAGAAADAPRG